MKTKIISTFLLIGLMSFTTYTNAQINVGKIKKPNINIKNGGSNKSGNNNSSTPALSKYDKYMKEGRKAESNGDYIAAYKAYDNALKEKTNDYSAKSAQNNIEDKAKEQYNQQLKTALEKEDCDAYKKTIDDLTATIAMSPGRKESWEKQKSDCQTQINNQKSNANKAAVAEKYNTLPKGTYFEKEFHTVDNLKTASIGDDLWMNIKMGKTMMEYSADFGLEGTFNAYGYFVIYMDGKKVATTKPLMFSSNYSKTWTDFDVPLSIPKNYGADKDKVTALANTTQGIWVVSNLGNESFVNKIYVPYAIKNFASKNGSHQLKIEFGLGEKGGTEPKGIISSGEMTINVDDTGKKALYKKGPKYMRPLDDNEKGEITLNVNSFTLGENTLKASIILPHPPKYYALTWCTTTSCDYDHGNLTLSAEINGVKITAGDAIWNEDWEKRTSFEFTLLPNNDHELTNDFASFNKELFFKKSKVNKFVYTLIDLIYSGKIKAGNNKLKISVGKTVVVGNDRITNEITTKVFNINITQSQINKFIASSSAKKLSHAGGEWSAVDKHLTSTHTNDHVIDVACYTEWKVTRNVYGVILYRNCKAEVLYKDGNGGYRIVQGIKVQEDYNGSSYGKPYFTGHFRTDWGYSDFNYMHFPVPSSKVK